jgi:hypothetical protein
VGKIESHGAQKKETEMKKMLLVGMAVLLTSAAFAYPSLQGPTGLVAVPTAATVATGAIDLAADYVYLPSTVQPGGTHTNDFPVRLEWGCAQNFEVGAAYDYIRDDQSWDINGKWVTPLNYFSTKVAVGAQYERFRKFGGSTPTVWNLYLVGTRPLVNAGGVALNGDLGLTMDKTDHIFANNTSFLRLMLGVDATVASLRNLNIAIDYIPQDKAISDTKAAFSIVGRMPITPMIGAEIGATTASSLQAGLPAAQVFAGLNLAYSTK